MSSTNYKNYSLSIVSLFGIVVLIINGFFYLFWNGFADHGEVCMSAVSWWFYSGHPIYTDLYAAERYSLEHGPIIYIVIGGIMKVLGPSIFSAKLSSILAVVSIVVLSWYWFKKLTDQKTAFWLLGLEAWILLRWYNFYFNRPDSLMVLCILISMIFTTTVKKRMPAIIGAAISLGILVNLKADGLFSAILVLILIYKRFGWKDFLYTIAIMVSTGLLPFILSNISLINYIKWLEAATAHGFYITTFFRVLGTLCLYFTGIISLGRCLGKDVTKIYKQNMFFIYCLLIFSCILALISSKHGSGSNHIAPLVPIIIYLLIITIVANKKVDNSSRNSWHKSYNVMIGIVFVLLIINGIDGQVRLIKDVHSFSMSREMVNDFNSIEKKYTGNTMMVGYGDSDETYCIYRQLVPLMVFKGNPYLFDACALMDMQYSGLKIPDATIRSIKDGKVRIWLIPKHNSPFALKNYYNHKCIFDDNFREAFLKDYTLIERTKYFDVWSYKANI